MLKGQYDEEHRKRSQTITKGKRKFDKFGPQKKKKKIAKVRCFRCQEYGHYKIDCNQRETNK